MSSLVQKMYLTKLNCFKFQIINVAQCVDKTWELTAEGKEAVTNGSHEALVYNAVPQEGVLQAHIMVRISCVIVLGCTSRGCITSSHYGKCLAVC